MVKTQLRILTIHSKQIVYRLMAYPTRFLADKYVAPSMLAGESRFGRKVVESKEFNILRNGFVIEDFEYNDENRRDIRKNLIYQMMPL